MKPRSPAEVLRIAHRGLELYSCPVDIAADGAHFVEIDVRVRADGALVVRHDLAGLDDAPLLPPALREIADAGLGAYLDVKALTPAAAGELLPVVSRAGLARRCIAASASLDVLALLPSALPRSVLFTAVGVDPLRLADTTGAQFVHPCWERLAAPHRQLSWLARVRARGLGVISWHEERPDILHALLDLGVDGICTDDVATLTRLATGGA